MTDPKSRTDPRRVKAVESATRLIELLDQLGSAGVTELSKHIDLSKGTISTQLATLRESGLVEKTNGKYHTGLRLLELGENAKNRYEISEVAKNQLDNLAQDSGCRTQLIVEEHGLGYCIYISRGPNALLPQSKVGQREHLHCTSVGKAILAHLSEDQVESIVEQHGLPEKTPNTVTSRQELLSELQTIQEQGYSLNDGENVPGTRAVGAPLLDEGRNPLGAISISDTVRNMDDQRFREEMPERIMNAANIIEVNYHAQC